MARVLLSLGVGLALLLLPIGLVPELVRQGGLAVGVPLLPEARTDARARYRETLAADARVGAAAAERWERAGERALAVPLALALPYDERLVAGDGTDEAVAFELALAPPDVLHLRSVAGEGAVGGLLVDVLQRRGPDVARLAAFGPAPVDLRWTPPVDGRYLVRVQTTLASRGGFGVALARRPALDFPVLTDAADPVRSRFGAPRDGGRREHHGIDIFAARGTPVVAAADGLIVRVGRSTRGGLHVWQRALDDEGADLGALYYAHLDSVSVLAGNRVARGETIGGVGNTGNARSTPPHLHFGLYRRRRGPIDPLPLTGERRVPPPEPRAGHALARRLAVAADALNLRAGPGTAFASSARLRAGELLEVRALSGDWARVVARSDDGRRRAGYVARRLLEPPRGTPLTLAAPLALLAAPEVDAPRLATLERGETVRLLGAFGRWRRVESSAGAGGWLLDEGAPEGGPTLPDG